MATVNPYLLLCIVLLFFLPSSSIQAVPDRIFSSGLLNDTITSYRYLSLCPDESYAGRIWQRDTMINSFVQGNGLDPDTLLTIELDVLSTPTVVLGGDSVICSTDSIATLKVEGVFAGYEWSTGESDREIKVNAPGVYTVTVTATSGCTAQEEMSVISSFPHPLVTPQDPTCAGQHDGEIRLAAFFGGVAPYESALDGGTFQSDSVFTGLSAGTYLVQWRDAAGCMDFMEINLQEPSVFTVEIGPDESLSLGDSLSLEATANEPIQRWQWEPADLLDCSDCRSPTVVRPRNATISLTAWNAGNCMATASKELTYSDALRLYVPNVFAPYRGLANTTLKIFPGPGPWHLAEFSVFDRWGQSVFHATGSVQYPELLEWDGRFRNELVPSGVYLWTARIVIQNGQMLVRSGTVSVL